MPVEDKTGVFTIMRMQQKVRTSRGRVAISEILKP